VELFFMRVPGWLFLVGIVVVVGMTALLSLLAFSVARQVAIDAGNVGIQIAAPALISSAPTVTPVSVVTVEATPAPTQESVAVDTTLQATATTDPAADLTYNDTARINILLLGIDQRSGIDDPGPFRTDTMIVVSIDPVRKSAGILSIPRDLWVDIPGYKPGRINTANSTGDSQGYPGGGPALAMETVHQVLGIKIDKYLLINFDVFTTLVQTIAPDGTEICINQMIDDPKYPDAGTGIIHIHFDPGCQTLNAEQLLQYARTRATAGSDFDRAARQQEVLKALHDKVLSVGGIAHFIGQAPALWNQLANSLKTNLTLDEILRLASLMQDIPKENMRFGQINNLYVTFAKTTSGDEVLLLKTNAIRLLLQQILTPEDNLTISELRTQSESEKATIDVFNNTDVAGLAGQTRDWLAGRGVTITNVGNTPGSTNENTVIHVYTGKIWTARYLATLMGLSADRVQPGADGLTTSDIAIVVGPDIQPILSGQQTND
jgi:polyisoprenyl-teichoic acid--peptidoglycan teichoic acid transferase